MPNRHRIPRETFPLSQKKDEVQKKITDGLADHKKRIDNILNPNSVISAPIEIKKKSKKFGLFNKK